MKCSRCCKRIRNGKYKRDTCFGGYMHLVCPVGASAAQTPQGFASTGGSAPSLAAKLQGPTEALGATHGETPVVNLVCSAPVERSGGTVEYISGVDGLTYKIEKFFVGYNEVQMEVTLCNPLFYRDGCLWFGPFQPPDSGQCNGQKATSSLKGRKGKRATARNDGAKLRAPGITDNPKS